MTTYTLNALCQSLRLEGMSATDESAVESEIRKLLLHNGPEFVIDRLKILKQHSIDQLTDPDAHVNFSNGSQSIAWNHQSNTPRGGLSKLYKAFISPEKRIRAIGATINSITLEEASSKQIERFVSGIKAKRKSTSVAPISDAEARTFVVTLYQQTLQMNDFSGRDLTGSTAPEGVLSRDLAGPKRDALSDDPVKRHKAFAELDAAVENQYVFAPRISSDYYRKLRQVNPDLRAFAKHSTGEKSRPYEFEKYKAYGNADDYAPYAGAIGFLQQPGGKLRTVCNVNRFTNYTLSPFHRALEEAFYHEQSVFVSRQDMGLDRVQECLRDGVEMTSADLSQATDLLDFRVFTRGLKEAIHRISDTQDGVALLRKDPAFKKQPWQQNTTGASDSFFDEVTPLQNALSAVRLALDTIEYFEETAQLPFFCRPLDEAFAFTTGQPLGLKGSFPMLSAMNLLAMRQATQYMLEENPEAPSWADMQYRVAVVGDDACMPAILAPYYSRVIEEWGGKDNSEKSLRSSEYAEFCSTLITPSLHMKMKPRYRPGSDALYINAEKTTLSRLEHVYRLSKEDKSLLSVLAQCYGPSIFEQESVKGANLFPLEDRRLLQRALRLKAQFASGGAPESIDVSRQTLDYAHQVHNAYRENDRIGDNRTYVRTPDGVVTTGVQSLVNHNGGSFSTTVDRFDHDTQQRIERQSLKKANASKKKAAKDLSKIVDTWKNNTDNSIDLGNGNSLSTQDLILGAISLSEADEDKQPSYIDKGRREEQKLSEAVRKARLARWNAMHSPTLDDDDFGPSL